MSSSRSFGGDPALTPVAPSTAGQIQRSGSSTATAADR